MNNADLCFSAIGELQALIQRREISSVELTKSFLERASELDSRLYSFITIMEKEAIAAARQADREISLGEARGPLHGIPMAVKDLFYTHGTRTTGGSKIKQWAEFIPGYDATVVSRLKQAGAIILGKLNMHEFAAGGTGENPHYGSTRNPWDASRMTGGSSGGSASAVGAAQCAAALGSDTGGSIRIPATFCGIVGLKPTFGRVSCYGVIPLAWTMDHVGPMTRRVEDAAIIMNAIAGYDPKDPNSANVEVPDYTSELRKGISDLRVGIPREFFYENLDRQVREALEEAIDVLGKLVSSIEDIPLPHMEHTHQLCAIIWGAESSTYHQKLLREHAPELTPGVRESLENGNFITAPMYIQAQRARTEIRGSFLQSLKEVDVLITPTSPVTAPKVGQTTVVIGEKEEPLRNHSSRLTRPLNLAGLPACTVPCGFTKDGLPIGLQIVGRPFDEATVLRVAYAYEQATEWHLRRPPI